MGAPATIGTMEAGMAVELFRYFAGWTDKLAGQTFPQDDGFLKIIRNEPLGVTAAIIPWNGPVVNVALKAAAALATGNCLILKPSEKTPFSALALGGLAKEAGFPAGVFQVLPGDGSTGALLASHMRIRKVSFTGSTATGKKILELAAKSNLKRVTLELGGKSPACVFDDCNVDNAAFWCANAITLNSGQVCFAASRVYVQEGIYDEFVEKYRAAVEEKAKAVGDPEAEGTAIGPVVDKLQFDRVTGFIERGKGQGRLLSGGEKIADKVSISFFRLFMNHDFRLTKQGFYVQPTIFANVPEDAEIAKQEIFGPVSILNKFKTEEEVIAKANDTEYGLMAGVFTQDINKALRVAANIESGMVGINCVSLNFPQAPFGGSKQSGIGRENGKDALLAWTETKTVMVNLTY